MISTGDVISTEEALRIGLVNSVVEPGDRIATAEAPALQVIANAPLGVQFAMGAIERGFDSGRDEGWFLESSLFGLRCATQDMREGTRVFIEKRAAKFQGALGLRLSDLQRFGSVVVSPALLHAPKGILGDLRIRESARPPRPARGIVSVNRKAFGLHKRHEKAFSPCAL